MKRSDLLLLQPAQIKSENILTSVHVQEYLTCRVSACFHKHRLFTMTK